MDELKRCPVCEGAMAYEDSDWAHYLRCQSLGCGLTYGPRVSKEKMIGMWNAQGSPAPAKASADMQEEARKFLNTIPMLPLASAARRDVDEALATAFQRIADEAREKEREQCARWHLNQASTLRTAVPSDSEWNRQMDARDIIMHEHYAATIRSQGKE